MEQKCIKCGKIATVNVQKLWMKWQYDAEKDEYSPKHGIPVCIEPLNGENLHLCDNCVALWEQGDI